MNALSSESPTMPPLVQWRRLVAVFIPWWQTEVSGCTKRNLRRHGPPHPAPDVTNRGPRVVRAGWGRGRTKSHVTSRQNADVFLQLHADVTKTGTDTFSYSSIP